MDLPLVLVERRDGVLVYRLPLWFRAVMALIFLAVSAALLFGGKEPGTVGWVIMTVLFLALLYRETWYFDTAKGEIRHRFGLLVVASRLVIPIESVTSFRLVPWVRGSVPGSAEEKRENDETLAASRGTQIPDNVSSKRRFLARRPYLTLVCESSQTTATINMVPGRKGLSLRSVADRIATYCGKPLQEG
ncbi:MAG TPA: hypothetical protein VMV44_05690 [Rectinemataceae bacterium]|nr:hypothetical protein [Rectinemataceae bacterium]